MKAGHTLPLTGDTASKTQGDLVVLGSDLQSLNYNELSDSLPNFVGFELIIGKGIQWNQPNVQVHFNIVLSTYLVLFTIDMCLHCIYQRPSTVVLKIFVLKNFRIFKFCIDYFCNPILLQK